MHSKLSSMLDKVADGLESKGLTREAYEVDKIADMVDKALDNPNIMPDWLKFPNRFKYREQLMHLFRNEPNRTINNYVNIKTGKVMELMNNLDSLAPEDIRNIQNKHDYIFSLFRWAKGEGILTSSEEDDLRNFWANWEL